MQTFRVTLHLAAPSLTRWQADTLFGHLCWALARREGDPAVQSLLEACRAGRPPLLLSDGFPGGMLPRPLFPPDFITTGTLEEQRQAMRQEKETKAVAWLSREEFATILRGERGRPDHKESLVRPFSTLHNQINRLTGTTSGGEDSASGNLYPLSGEWSERRTVYVRAEERLPWSWRQLFRDFEATGFGKRKSVGYGAVRQVDIEEDFAGFEEPVDADGFVSLSSFVPKQTDPTEGYWNVGVKYGKLGEERAATPNPFKKPLVRLTAGSVFRTARRPEPFYGRLVEDIAPGFADVCQYGFAFAVGLRWPH